LGRLGKPLQTSLYTKWKSVNALSLIGLIPSGYLKLRGYNIIRLDLLTPRLTIAVDLERSEENGYL
jgi:hypothetical protein